MILCHKLWFSNPYIFETQCCKPLIFQTYIIWSNRTHSLKYQRSRTLESKDIVIRKSEFVAKTQLLWSFCLVHCGLIDLFYCVKEQFLYFLLFILQLLWKRYFPGESDVNEFSDCRTKIYLGENPSFIISLATDTLHEIKYIKVM